MGVAQWICCWENLLSWIEIFPIDDEELKMIIALPTTNVMNDLFWYWNVQRHIYEIQHRLPNWIIWLLLMRAKTVPRIYVWMNYVRDLSGENNLENSYLVPLSNQVCRGTLAGSSKLEVIFYNNYLWENIMTLELCLNLIHNDNFWRYILRHKFDLIDFK